MSELTWEKVPATDKAKTGAATKVDQYKFLIGGVLLLAAILYLVVSGMTNGTQYFITVDELLTNPEFVGQTVRISGAVIGETIVYDEQTLNLDFTIAHIPKETNDLAYTLYLAVQDPSAKRLSVHLENEVKPDLLQNEAQAILTGKLGNDGVFYATELLLKCPSRYEETIPDQAVAATNP